VFAAIAHGGDTELKILRPDLDGRHMRQVGGLRQHFALMRRVLVEHIDGRTDQRIHRYGKMLFNAPQRFHAGTIGIVNTELAERAGHDV